MTLTGERWNMVGKERSWDGRSKLSDEALVDMPQFKCRTRFILEKPGTCTVRRGNQSDRETPSCKDGVHLVSLLIVTETDITISSSMAHIQSDATAKFGSARQTPP